MANPHEITGRCGHCGTSLTLPMADEFQSPEHPPVTPEELGVDDAWTWMREYLEQLRCPSCGRKELRITLPDR